MIEIEPRSFGKRVRKKRKAHGYTQPELAKLVGITQPSLSDIENDKTSIDNIKGPTLLGLIEHLKTTEDYLRTGKGDRPEPAPPAQEDALLDLFRRLPSDSDRAEHVGYLRGIIDGRAIEHKPRKHSTKRPTKKGASL